MSLRKITISTDVDIYLADISDEDLLEEFAERGLDPKMKPWAAIDLLITMEVPVELVDQFKEWACSPIATEEMLRVNLMIIKVCYLYHTS